MSEIRLRRVKARLTAEQWAEAQKRALVISERLEEKEEREQKAATEKK